MVSIDQYLKHSTLEKKSYEKVSNGDFLSLIIYNDFAEIKFNSIEFVLVKNVENLCSEFLGGKYTIKLYLYNSNMFYSKLIWKDKELRRYNQRTKYGVLRCEKINMIRIIQGIPW